MTLDDEIYIIEELLKNCFNELDLNKVALSSKSILLNQFLTEVVDSNYLKDEFKKGTTKRSQIEIFISDAKTYRNGGIDDSSIKLGFNQSKKILNNEKLRLKKLHV